MLGLFGVGVLKAVVAEEVDDSYGGISEMDNVFICFKKIPLLK
ncbi:hypothetical protein [Coxiella-like endosymbiont]|nr:hypothetical protein [Coxiella-like endosymbiont]